MTAVDPNAVDRMAGEANQHVHLSQRDDHPQYARTDGTRAFTGPVSVPSLTVSGNETVGGTLTVGGAQVMPSGVIFDYAGSSVPTGWLVCDGSAVSRTTYANLFTAIGATWGAGDGSTTFNVPDLRGRAAIGSGQGSGLTNRTLAGTGGEETHVLSVAELAAHNHPASDSGHGHGLTQTGLAVQNDPASTQGMMVSPSGVKAQGDPISVNTGNASVSTSNTGSGTGHNNMQPFAVVTKIIKT